MDRRAFSYWTLKWLRSLREQGVFFLMRDIAGIVLWLDNERLDLLAVLPTVQGQRLDLLVDVGASKLLRGVRLLAERVPAAVAAQRQERIRQYASDHGKPVNALLLELANWTIVVTNVPLSRLTFEQALARLAREMADRIALQAVERARRASRLERHESLAHSL